MKALGGINRDLSILIDEVNTEAAGVLTSDNTQPAVADTVTIGSRIYTMVDALGVAVKATGLVTSDATNPANNSTITIGLRTYTYKDTLTGAANEIKVGADAATTLDNLKSALNASAGAGTAYGTGTVANALVTATTNTDTTQLLEAVTAGTGGNALALSGTGTHHLTFTAFAGGIDATTADQVLIQTDADTTLGNLRTLINSGRAAVAASGILTSDNTKPTAADTATVGGKVYTFVAALTEAFATGTLTSDQTQPAAGDTVTVGTQVYEFVAALETTDRRGQVHPIELPNKVLIGADADTTLGNLVAAINKDSGEGTKYSFNTVVNPLASAAAVSSHATVVTARTVGTGGNSIAKAETSSHLDWDGVGAVFTGGVASVANEISLVGADADFVMNSLIAAINGGSGAGVRYSTATVASTELTAGTLSAHAFTVTASTAGAAGNALAKSEASTHLDWDGTGAFMTGGIDVSAAHSQVTAGTIAAHAFTVTANSGTSFAGNAIAKAESSAHLDWDGAGAFLTGGGSTVGTSEEIGEDGKLSVIVSECPQFTGTPTYTVSLVDSSGKVNYVSGNLTENATTRTVVEQSVKAGDKVVVTTSTVVENTLPVLVRLR